MPLCPQCGNQTTEEVLLCSECVRKLDSEKKDVEFNTRESPLAEITSQEKISPALPQEEAYCKNCGAKVLKDAYACLSCGLPPSKGKNYCPCCGATTHADAVVCIKCGIKLNSFSFITRTSGLHTGNINTANLGNKAGLVGAIMVFIGFFMPWLDISYFSISGYSAVFSGIGNQLGEGRFLLLILPLSAIIFLYQLFLGKSEKGLMNLLKILPVIFIVISAIILYSKITEGRHGNFDDFNNNLSTDFFKIFGMGFWFTLIGALIMAFHNEKKG